MKDLSYYRVKHTNKLFNTMLSCIIIYLHPPIGNKCLLSTWACIANNRIIIKRTKKVWSSLVKGSHWLARKLPHSTVSWVDFFKKIEHSAFQKQPIFLLNGMLSGKLVTPLYLNSSTKKVKHKLYTFWG